MHYRIPMAYFWNATVQHQFAGGLSFQVAYVGNVGRHLYENPNINQAVPGPGDFDPRRPFYPKFGLEQGIYYTCNCDTSNYNGLQAKLEKHASHGLDFTLNYTYSKALGVSSFGGGGFDNNYDVRRFLRASEFQFHPRAHVHQCLADSLRPRHALGILQ